MSFEQYARHRDFEDRRKALRKEHKQRQRRERREAARQARLRKTNSIGTMTAVVAQRAYVPSAPTLRKRTPARV